MRVRTYIRRAEAFTDSTEFFLSSRWLRRAIQAVILLSVLYFGPYFVNIFTR